LTAGFGASTSQPFIASVSNSNSSVEVSSLDVGTSSGTLTPTTDAAVRLRMTCKVTGQDFVTLQLDFAGYDSMRIQFVKVCLVNDTNVHGVFNIASKDWTHTIEEGDIVARGKTLSLWQGDQSKGAGNYVVFDRDTNQHTFFMWLFRGVQPYAVVADESELDRVAVTINPVRGLVTRQTPGEWTANFTVQFTWSVFQLNALSPHSCILILLFCAVLALVGWDSCRYR
jgi:hypothetical protein